MRKIALAAAAVVMFTAAAQAQGDPRPPLWEFLTAERYTRALLQVGVLALRSHVDFTYNHITSDPHAGAIAMHGLKVYPDVPWPGEARCEIKAERARISGASPASWDTLRLRIGLQGATVSLGCIMPPVDQQIKAAGIDRIAMRHLDIDLSYRVGPGSLAVSANGGLTDLAAVTVNLDFPYFSIQEDDEFTARLSHASVTLDDSGLWARAQQILPPEFKDPNAVAAMLQAGLAEALRPVQIHGQPAQRMGAAQQEFINAAVRSVRRFMEEPGSLTIEAHPAEPVLLDLDAVEDPQTLFERLQPTVSRHATPAEPVIGTAKLKAALNSPETLEDADRLLIGKALLSGIGAPRAEKSGRALLEPLATAGNGEAALALAGALRDSDPKAAYLLTLEAGERETDGAVALLDALEQQLTTPEVLTLQSEFHKPKAPPEEGYASLQAMRSRAIMHMTGFGAPRSYRQALYWATLGSAAGDRAAARLTEDLADRMRYRGEAATEAWRKQASAVAEAALADWLERGLADRFLSDR